MANFTFASVHTCKSRQQVQVTRNAVAHVSRRHAIAFPTLTAVVDPRTLVNSVLSGYGLPTVGNAKGFVPYDNFSNDYEFSYPRSWVVRCVPPWRVNITSQSRTMLMLVQMWLTKRMLVHMQPKLTKARGVHCRYVSAVALHSFDW